MRSRVGEESSPYRKLAVPAQGTISASYQALHYSFPLAIFPKYPSLALEVLCHQNTQVTVTSSGHLGKRAVSFHTRLDPNHFLFTYYASVRGSVVFKYVQLCNHHPK